MFSNMSLVASLQSVVSAQAFFQKAINRN